MIDATTGGTATQQNTAANLNLIYIGGYGRSGSTLLDRMLGQLDDVCAVGELRHIWERGLVEDQLCGCGTPFWQCPFWSLVLEEAFGSIGNVEPRALLDLQRKVDRMRNIPATLQCLPVSLPRKHAIAEYSAVLERMYRAIGTVSGKQHVVDSSKDPSHGFLLRTLNSIDLGVVHLVRDSRAVAYSWQRVRHRREIQSRHEFMPRYSLLKSGFEWMLLNTLVERLCREVQTHMRISYEGLVADVERVLNELLRRFRIPSSPLTFLHEGSVILKSSHTVSGNPMRFRTGTIDLHRDDEWISKMAPHQKVFVSMLTWPLLLRYGYV